MRPTYAEIDLGAIHHNLREIRKKIGVRPRIMAVVKANAYGHGMLEVTKSILQEEAASYLGVAIVEEGITLRKNGVKAPILVLTAAPEPQLDLFVKHRLEATICSLTVARSLNRIAAGAGRKSIVHLKVDTGMGRIGISPRDTVEFVQRLRTLDHLTLEGIFTHFATSDEANLAFARRQLSQFKSVIEGLSAAGIHIPMKHSANSGAILQLPESYFDVVRPGIMIYGYLPSRAMTTTLPLKPAMSLRSRIEFMKTVERGTSISYGRRYTTASKTKIGSVAIGYGDGYSRRLTNKATALVNGREYPVVGTICMDQVMINVGLRSRCKAGDPVTLMGRDGTREISCWQIAEKLGTIPYEVFCSVTDRVPRKYING